MINDSMGADGLTLWPSGRDPQNADDDHDDS